MNCWRFSPAIFEACRRLQPSPRGELELPMAVREAIASGVRFKVVRCREGVLDLSRRSDIPAVAERLRGVSADP
jgi:glucose-1-phosphate thymidylyltransferase